MLDTWKEDPQAEKLKATLLLAVVLSSLLHVVNVSVPCLLLCLFMWLWHFVSLFRPLPKPGAKFLTVAGAFCFAVAASTNEGVTVESFVSLLVLMIALKLFELKRLHDAIMTAILNYFAIVSGMFFSDSLAVTAYIALCVLYNTAALVRVSQPGTQIQPCLRHAARLSVQALPFMIVLFLVFPRFQGGLWGRPQLIQARSGVSDTLRLGGVAEVARNTEVAFRVSFADGVPLETLYWRGVVLWHFDGEQWTRGPGRRHSPAELVQASGPERRYTMTVEAHEGNWLYTLDRPLSVQSLRGMGMGASGMVDTMRPVSNRVEYQAVSDTAGKMRWLARSRWENSWGLQLPEDGNPRARALAQSWQGAGPEEIVNAGLAHFSRGGFRYTLAPDADLDSEGTKNAIDRFLFERRAGFCEHFASSFAFLMRAAGVPARLLIGYLGGTLNPYGEYLVVRHADAHAWCEVLINGEWRRVDPTAVVAPGRLRLGSESRLAGTDLTLNSFFSLGNLPPWLQPLGNGWDYLNMRWNQAVMQYSASQQRQLFSFLGLDWGRRTARLGLLIGAVAVLGIGYFFAIVFFRRKTHSEDEAARVWLKFKEKLTAAAFPVPGNMGPGELVERLKKERPDLASAAEAVSRLYIRLRYARPESAGAYAQSMQAFREAVRRFQSRKMRN